MALRWLVLIASISLASATPIPTDCITYDLEDDFDQQFSADRDCAGRDTWHPGNYEEFGMSPPHQHSSSFVFANTTSCVRTTKLQKVLAGSVYQFNVFLDTVSGMTNLFMYIYSMTDWENGLPVSVGTMSSALYSNGWHDLRVRVPTNVEEAYMAFDVTMAPGSTTIVDSFRWGKKEGIFDTCPIYGDSFEEDTSEIIISSEEISEEGSSQEDTGQPSSEEISEEQNSSQEPVVSSSEENESEQKTGCKTFDLEQNVENLFASDRDCTQFPAFGPWEDGGYDELDIEVDGRGTRFIRPSATGSCSRTLEVFPVIRGGIIEVNCFIKMAEGSSGVAFVNILAQNYADGTTVGVAAFNSNFHSDGWHKITIDSISNDVKSVSMLFVGAVPPGSILLIDSFRYFEYKYLEDTCKIYPDKPLPGPGSSEEDTGSESSENESSSETSEEPATSESPENESSSSNSEEVESTPEPDRSDNSQESVQISSSSEADESKSESDRSDNSQESVQIPRSSEENESKSESESDRSDNSQESVQISSSSEADESKSESDRSDNSQESVHISSSSEADESKSESDRSDNSQESVQIPRSSEENESKSESDKSDSSQEWIKIPKKIIQKFKFKNSKVFNCIFCKFT